MSELKALLINGQAKLALDKHEFNSQMGYSPMQSEAVLERALLAAHNQSRHFLGLIRIMLTDCGVRKAMRYA